MVHLVGAVANIATLSCVCRGQPFLSSIILIEQYDSDGMT
jgi:hypothetical protein